MLQLAESLVRRGRLPGLALVIVLLAAGPYGTPAHATGALARVGVDQVDDLTGSQIHVMYVLPSDGVDQQLDTSGTIATSVSAVQSWLLGQTLGRTLRMDTYGGALDITFARLSRTDAVMQGFGAFIRDQIESELGAGGFLQAGKIYLVYYGGGSTSACASAPWPPALIGQVGVLYLKGTPAGATPCATNVLGGSPTVPAYWEFTALHEVLHTLGAVPSCAPHHTLNGHSSDSPTDLMYAGNQPWAPSVLDIGRDDYYGHSNSGCFDLATSPFLAPAVVGAAYFSDDMESGSAKWPSPQSPWAITTESAHSGTHAWSDSPGGNYASNVNKSLYSTAIDLSAATRPLLTFWQRRALFADGDVVTLWASTDHLQTYTFLTSFTGTNLTWSQTGLDLSAFAGQSSVQLAFQIFSNTPGVADGWYIDDVVVAETAVPTPTRVIGVSGNLAFGTVTAGTSATSTLTISNMGNSTLTITGITYPPGFSGAFSGPIAAGANQQVTVTFSPAQVTSYGGTITVQSDKTSGTDTIGVSGTGAPGVLFDFTGDRKSDVLWRHTANGQVWLWPMNGPIALSENFVRTVSDTNWEIRGQGDQNGDGKADILWRNKLTGGIVFWPMNGSVPLSETFVAAVDPAYDIAGSGDYNGDGRSDILWRHTTNGQVWIWLMNGATAQSIVHVDTVDPVYAIVGSGDLDGNQKADIVWRHTVTGNVWVWLMNGTTRLSQTLVGTVPDLGYQVQGVADFTGDGKADLLWRHTTQGHVWIWPMNGASVMTQSFVATVDPIYKIMGAGDYDGDTRSDIVWHHSGVGDVWVWLMNGVAMQSQTLVGKVPDTGYQIVKWK